MVNVTWAVWLRLPPCPVMVIVNVPGGDEGAVEMVSVEVKGGVPLEGLKDADAPAGVPERVRSTPCAVPETEFTLIM